MREPANTAPAVPRNKAHATNTLIRKPRTAPRLRYDPQSYTALTLGSVWWTMSSSRWCLMCHNTPPNEPMRLALISDIHSNIPALEAVLTDIRDQGFENILCLGDVIGYGPHPGRCIDMVQQNCSACLKGNHEEALLDANEAASFNPRARRAIDWTRHFIQTDGDAETQQRRWQLFETLKTQARSGSFYFVHASPRDPTKEYVLPRESQNTEKMNSIFGMIEHLCFVGHTHVPGVFLEDGTYTPPDKLWGSTYFIDDDEKALINVGSVGQPRDGDIRACYCVIDNDDIESPRVYFRRIEYDIEQTITDIQDNSMLDNSLAERLRHGR